MSVTATHRFISDIGLFLSYDFGVYFYSSDIVTSASVPSESPHRLILGCHLVWELHFRFNEPLHVPLDCRLIMEEKNILWQELLLKRKEFLLSAHHTLYYFVEVGIVIFLGKRLFSSKSVELGIVSEFAFCLDA